MKVTLFPTSGLELSTLEVITRSIVLGVIVTVDVLLLGLVSIVVVVIVAVFVFGDVSNMLTVISKVFVSPAFNWPIFQFPVKGSNTESKDFAAMNSNPPGSTSVTLTPPASLLLSFFAFRVYIIVS